MIEIHPLDILQGYRLGSRQATVELQRTDVPGIHIDFKVLQLVDDVVSGQVRAVILTGTAGDGKTYLAYKILERLGLERQQVLQAQPGGGYHVAGTFIDLDLSAGALTAERVERLHQVLSQPEKLTLICANEGKLADLEERLAERGQAIPPEVLRINLSRRALVSPDAWSAVLAGVAEGPVWQGYSPVEGEPLAQNRAWLQDPAVANRLRSYLLLPYLLGEPITIRETLSFLAYILGGGPDAAAAANLPATERVRYLLFNTLFSEPEGYVHGQRAVPTEKLLWWLYRFDPATQASPEVDLKLLVELDKLEVAPPAELLAIWKTELLVTESEKTDTAYRHRLNRYMQYARRWYALASDEGFRAYFPFRHFNDYLKTLLDPAEDEIPELIRGLNLLLSGGQVSEEFELKIYYLPPDGAQFSAAIYSDDAKIDETDLQLIPDSPLDGADQADAYLERLPRHLYLVHDGDDQIRLPVSLLLYEVLRSAASPAGGFPATLWAKERDTVARFMAGLARSQGATTQKAKFIIVLNPEQQIKLGYHPKHKKLTAN